MTKKDSLKLAYEAYINEVKKLVELNYMKLEEALSYEEFCKKMK